MDMEIEEIVDQLHALNEPVPVPLELPDEDLLVEIEEQLLIGIPCELRQFLLYASDVVYGHLEPVTVTDPQSHTFLPEVAANAWDAGVPRHLVPLCQDGLDYYLVDMESQVLHWDGRTETLNEEDGWDSVWHWVLDVWMKQA